MIDTHAHIDMDCYKEKFESLMEEINTSGVEKVIIPGVIPQDFGRIISLIEQYDNLYGAIGVHPSELNKIPDNWLDEVEQLLSNKKVVAIGEIGLDYYWDKDADIQEKQKKVLLEQVELAKKYKLPVLIHDREAHGDCFDILSGNIKGEIPVIMHCFSGSWEFGKRCLNEGWYLALGGVVTFKNAKKIHEIAKNIPLDRLLLETDSPYLTPVPHRGEENSPAYIKFVAEEIARLRNISFEEIDKITTENAKKIFRF